jgi:hypothetical protein
MRVHKLREEAIEKERDEHFNTIPLVIPMKQEWRVKDKANTPALTGSDNDMDLLNNNESLLIKDGSPPPIDMDMAYMMSSEFRDAEEGCRGVAHLVVPRP